MLQQNPYDLWRDTRLWEQLFPGKNGPELVWTQPNEANWDRANALPPGVNWSLTDNQALARFNGKLRKGSASMGVTLASWKQSREMIVKRSSDLSRVSEKAYRRLKGDSAAVKRLRHQRDPLANEVLETEFGWRPLLQDFHSALTTVCQDGIPPQWVTGIGSMMDSPSTGWQQNGPSVRFKDDWLYKMRSSHSAQVSISNPNLWLLNRLGLINPATIALDLIPWSFVVTMVSNLNAVISQVTDEVGLEVTDRSHTRTVTSITNSEYWNSNFEGLGFKAQYLYRRKTRVLGFKPAVTWQVRVPKLNWELALIASSLVVQRISKLNRLIRGI